MRMLYWLNWLLIITLAVMGFDDPTPTGWLILMIPLIWTVASSFDVSTKLFCIIGLVLNSLSVLFSLSIALASHIKPLEVPLIVALTLIPLFNIRFLYQLMQDPERYLSFSALLKTPRHYLSDVSNKIDKLGKVKKAIISTAVLSYPLWGGILFSLYSHYHSNHSTALADLYVMSNILSAVLSSIIIFFVTPNIVLKLILLVGYYISAISVIIFFILVMAGQA